MEQKDNTGVLFINEKRTSDKSPRLTGKAMIGGKPKSLSVWQNKDKKGKVYYKISFQEPYKAETTTTTPPPTFAGDEDLPF